MRRLFGGMGYRLLGLGLGILLVLAVPHDTANAVSPSSQGSGASFSITIGEPSFYFSLTIQDPDTRLAHALFLGCMAAFFDMDSQVVLQIGGNADPRPPGEVLSLLYISAQTHTTPTRIFELRKRGYGWGRLAKIHGLPAHHKGKVKPGKATIYTYSDAEFEDECYVSFISTYYAVPESDIRLWLSKKYTIYDITVALNLSARTKASPTQILALRHSGTSWKSIAAKYKVKYEDLSKPVKPKGKFGSHR